MSVTCQHTMRVPFPLSHIQIACNGVYLALPFVRTSIGVWSLDKLFCKPLELEGHRHKASAMCFGPSHFPTKLCTAAEDYIIVWDLQQAKIMKDTGQQIRGQIIGTTLGFISYCCFSPDESQVAVCRDLDVLILSSLEEKLCVTLEGHDARVTCAEFCPHYSSTLVTAAEDRTFKVWNIKQGSLIYQSTIISSSPFLCLAMNPSDEQFAIGTADGQVRVYDLSDGNGFRCLHQLDVEKIIQKQKTLRHKVTEEEGPLTISSQPSWKQSQRPGGQQEQSAEDDVEESEVGSAILGLHYSYQQVAQSQENGAKLHLMKHDETLVRDLLTAAPLLTIGTTGAVVQVNAKTLEQDLYFNLQSPLNCEPNMESSISVAGSCAFSSTTDLTKTWCVVGSLFENIAQVLLVSHSQPVDQQQSLDQLTGGIAGLSTQGPDVTKEEDNAQGDITVLSDVPLLPNSLLRAELVPKSKESKGSPSGKKGVLLPSKKSSVLDNQPLTFKNKVKSSGYTEAPRRTMFQPKTGSSKATSSPKTGKSSGLKKLEKEYPVNSAPPTHLHVKLDVEEKPVPIQCVKFSGDGQYVACALANKSAHLFKMPLSGSGTAFTGHNGVVNSVRWNHDNKYLISASDDKTASVWVKGQAEPILTFSTLTDNFGVDKEGGLKPSKDNPLFPKEISVAQFYYMDKFVLLTAGSTFYLYKYFLDSSKQDIKRYISKSRYKLVKSFQLDQAQKITAMSAVNGFYSYIVLCAGSNKSIEIFDMNAGQSVRVVEEAHSRPIHVLCQNEGSSYVTHPPESYNLFVTAAASDCIKLWDLRTNRCIRKYEGHINRSHSCGLAISPCSRFIASGAEDRAAYIFDIRSGTYLHKLTGHTDTVTDVEFHPLYPELLTSTLDGKLRLFKTS